MADFAIRPYRESDAAFVFKAWLRGYWEHFPGRVIVRERPFMKLWHVVIELIMEDEQTRTVVAHVEGEPDSLLGFACGSPAGLHWAYVKQPWRHFGYEYDKDGALVAKRPGIGTALMGATAGEKRACRISHWPGKLVDGWTYAPELLREYGG